MQAKLSIVHNNNKKKQHHHIIGKVNYPNISKESLLDFVVVVVVVCWDFCCFLNRARSLAHNSFLNQHCDEFPQAHLNCVTYYKKKNIYIYILYLHRFTHCATYSYNVSKINNFQRLSIRLLGFCCCCILNVTIMNRQINIHCSTIHNIDCVELYIYTTKEGNLRLIVSFERYIHKCIYT